MARPLSLIARRDRALAVVAALAEDVAGAAMRETEAARILDLAREVAMLAQDGHIAAVVPSDAAGQVIVEIARHWDPAAVTAREYVESLPVVVTDRLLRAGPAWAAGLLAPKARRAA